MKKIATRIIAFIFAEAAVIFFSLLAMTNNCVKGIAVNSSSYFAAALEIWSTNKYDLLFYDSDGRQTNSIRIEHRGSITIGCIDDLLIVQGGTGNIRAFDFFGNEVSDFAFSGRLKAVYSYSGDGFSVNCRQDRNGDEFIELTDKNGTRNVDINYSFYKRSKISVTFISFCVLNALMISCYNVLKKCQWKISVSKEKSDSG